jgi:putative flippase GtrA
MTPPPAASTVAEPELAATMVPSPTLLQPALVEGLLSRRETIFRFARFVTVGGLASAVYLGLTAVLLHTGMWYMAAAAIGFSCAIVTNFTVNRSWTFGKGERGVFIQLASFAAVQLSMMVLNLGMLFLVVEAGLVFGPIFLSQLAVAAVLLPLNFIASKRWGFR